MTDSATPNVVCLKQLADSGAKELLPHAVTGLEKESLRVTTAAEISQLPHPAALGSTLTHTSITTDYSEALLEFITPPNTCIKQSVEAMTDIHRYVYQNLPKDEMLWVTSMPCIVDEKNIPIADYGSSNIGKMKHIYRKGLDVRYGRAMQAIAGIHFNWSMPDAFWPLFQEIQKKSDSIVDFKSTSYFGLVRNFQRLSWMIPYLFGASPAICKSFTGGEKGIFDEFDGHTFYLPHATSLRMSDVGYKNSTQARLNVSYDNVDKYVSSLTKAIETPAPEYEAIGTHLNGEWTQLNTNFLQIENEFYSSVRPKQIAESGEKPTQALKRRGVAYVEMRALDLNPYDPAGMSSETLHFIEAIMMYCLWAKSPVISDQERKDNEHNQLQVALYGRDPSLKLQRDGKAVLLKDWANEIVDHIEPIVAMLDDCCGETTPYNDTLATQRAAIADSGLTPSAKVITDMRDHSENFVRFGMRRSAELAEQIKAQPPSAELAARLATEAGESIAKQKEIEAADTVGFDTYLKDYFSRN